MIANRIVFLAIIASLLVSTGASAGTKWKPSPDDALQLDISATPTAAQLHGPFTMIELDGFDTPASVVRSLHALGKKTVCYVDVGTWENWRPDAARFQRSVLGASDLGWTGERWLDIRQRSVLLPIMKSRFELCARKGFDAVDPDNVDGVENHTGFALTMSDQIAYDRSIATLAHQLHMAVALKSFASGARALQPYFDFVVDEQCVQYGECGSFGTFLQNHKPVFDIEYTPSLSFCGSLPRGVKGIEKRLTLDDWVRWCP